MTLLNKSGMFLLYVKICGTILKVSKMKKELFMKIEKHNENPARISIPVGFLIIMQT